MTGIHPECAAATSIEFEPALIEQLGFVRLYAGIAQSHVEAGDFAGLAYSIRQLTARTRFVVNVLNDLGKLREAADGVR